MTTFDGAIAAVACDLHALFNIDNNTGSISTKAIGTAPNQEFVIQWKSFRPYVNSTSTTNYFNWNFQIRLHQDGTIAIVYDLKVTGTPSSTSSQVGIRGVSATDFNNRYAGGTANSNWMSTTPGSGNTSVIYSNSTSLPTSGYTFTWVPPVPCTAPLTQPTAFISTVEGIVVNGSFTASSPAADKYLVIRTPQGTIPNVPADGTNYTTGDNTALNGRVIYIGTATSFTDNAFNGIVENTDYTYTIYALNSACTGGPLYNTTTPLTATITTCPGPINTLTSGNATPTTFNLNWTPNNGDALPYSYSLLVATDSAFANQVAGSPFTIASTETNFQVGNLSANTKYFYKIKAESTCSGIFSSTGNITTLCNPVTALNETFTGITTSNPLACWTTTGWEIGSARGATGVNGATNIYKNLYGSAATGTVTSITVGPIAANSELNFDYKQSNFNSPYAALINWGNYNVQISTNSGANWTTLLNVDNEAGTGSYIHKTISLAGYAGNYVTFKITANRTAGDFDLSFDNFEIKVNTPACAEPGNNTGDLGCVNFTYNGQTQTYTTVRAADGNIWLQQNLGSANVATTMTDENSYGDLFQWGRWADGHQKRSSETSSTTPSPNNPTGITNGFDSFITSSPGWWSGNELTDEWTAPDVASIAPDKSCDPCKALGEGWKMPTQIDWTKLVDEENITNPASAYDSTLKLPANGFRSSSNGDFTYAGQRGYYWSSTPTGIGAKYLYVGTTIANPAAGAMRAQGAGIRCVKIQSELGTGDWDTKTISLYPNPTTDFIHIRTASAVKEVRIYNQLGQLISSQKTETIDLSKAPNGMYMVQLTFENNLTATKKVLKK